jgi:hypothetical protein
METDIINTSDLIYNANMAKELVVWQLLADGAITEEQAEKYVTSWNIVVIDTKWFERWANNIGIIKHGHRFKYVNFDSSITENPEPDTENNSEDK